MNEYEKLMKLRPHVVLLGAGASIAAIPNGDANGRRTSVMDGFIEKLGMKELLESVKLDTKSNNLEDIYSELSEVDDCVDVIKSLENSIHKYFSSLTIPDEVTIYDLLLLSLREKDVIATFNWDPLLLQAYNRVHNITPNLPQLLFLHGNVLVGLCEEHKRGGILGSLCPVCHRELMPSKLLYPIKNKNYTADGFIADNWNAVAAYMKRAYVVTIFGYSAPKTDEGAISLLKKAWGSKEERNLEEIEIIDIKPEDELYSSWEQFIHTHHYQVFNNFFDSVIAKYPRRSCDATFDRLMNVKFLDETKGLKDKMSFNDLENYFKPLLVEEQVHNGAFYVD